MAYNNLQLMNKWLNKIGAPPPSPPDPRIKFNTGTTVKSFGNSPGVVITTDHHNNTMTATRDGS